MDGICRSDINNIYNNLFFYLPLKTRPACGPVMLNVIRLTVTHCWRHMNKLWRTLKLRIISGSQSSRLLLILLRNYTGTAPSWLHQGLCPSMPRILALSLLHSHTMHVVTSTLVTWASFFSASFLSLTLAVEENIENGCDFFPQGTFGCCWSCPFDPCSMIILI